MADKLVKREKVERIDSSEEPLFLDTLISGQTWRCKVWGSKKTVNIGIPDFRVEQLANCWFTFHRDENNYFVPDDIFDVVSD